MKNQENTFERYEQLFAKWIVKKEELKCSKAKKNGYYELECSPFESKMSPDIKYCPQLMITEYGNVYFKLWCISKNVIGSNCFVVKVQSANRIASYMCQFSNGFCFLLCSQNKLMDESKNYFVNDELIIEIYRIVKNDVFELPEIDVFQYLDVTNEEKDFVIAVKGNEIKVHKKILIEFSPVFAAMFQSKWKESIENRQEILDFSFEVVQTAINFLYNGYINNIYNATENIIIELLYFADKYEINQLMICVQNYLIPKISMSNVYEFTNLSIITNAPELQKRCIAMLQYCKINDPEFNENSKQVYPEIITEINEKSVVTVCKSI